MVTGMNEHDGLMPEQRCWQLLATAAVGRLALSVRALPVIVPVQYHLTGRRLAACLGARQVPLRALDKAVIAFTADDIDPDTGTGWSVHVQGRSRLAARPEAGCGSRPEAGQLIEIEPVTMHGWRVCLCPLTATRQRTEHLAALPRR